MTMDLLWASLGLFILASLSPGGVVRYRMLIAGIGWIFFASYWALQPLYYIKEGDFSMVLLMLLVAFLCLVIAHMMITIHAQLIRGEVHDNPTNRQKTLLTITTITVIGCLFYFPFAEIPSLNRFLISAVTGQTIWLSHLAGFDAVRLDWNLVMLEGYRVEIILACTAIESIALFFGLILGIKAEMRRILIALLVSVPVIYILNLIRNVFVIAAYGYQWFGTGPLTINVMGNFYYLHESISFYLSHHIIAKLGSGIALFFIAYAVLKLLPELLEIIDDLFMLIKEDIRRIIRGG